jgi:hypothetical protein
MSTLKGPVKHGSTSAQDWPAYWLVCLERALAEGNFADAATAQRELRRLGLDVTMKILPKREEVTNVA